jgi:hypothetical protein
LVCVHGHPTIQEELKRSTATLVGVVTAQKAVPDSGGYYEGVRYQVRVENLLKGTLSDSISLFSENSSGRFPMTVGHRYVLFVYKESGRLAVDNCGNSGPLPAKAGVVSAVKRLLRP